MSYFEVGDTVERVDPFGGASLVKVGDIVKVIETDTLENEDYVRVTNSGNGESHWLSCKRFKLVARKSMEKSAEQIREEILRIDTLIEKSKKDIEEAEKKRESFVEQLREKGFLFYEKEGAFRCAPTLSVEDVHVGDHLILTKDSYNYLIRQGSIVSVEVNDTSGLPFCVRCLSTGKRDWVKLENVKRA